MIQRLWENYKDTVVKHCTYPQDEITGLAYWRNDLFAMTVLYLIPLSFIAFVPGIYMAYQTDLLLLLWVDVISILIFLIIIFVPGISVYARKLMLCITLYCISLTLLYSLGSYGPGLLYLLGITLFVVLIFDEMIALWSVLLNIIACMLFGAMIYYNWGGGVITLEYDIASWFAVSSNLIFLSAVAVLLIPRLFKGLETAFETRNQLENELKRKQLDLEQSLVQLEEKNSELEKFAYIASHDLKEPLRMTRSFVELLNRKYSDKLDDKGQTYIDFAIDGANRMTRLIDELLEYSRVGRVHDELELIDLNRLIQEIMKDLPEAEKAEITMMSLPEIQAVPISMKMLFRNLISNSLKYQTGEQKAEVSIVVSDENDYQKFSISDNGIGIDEKYFNDIFLLFKRLHSPNEFPGSGMGLAICKKVVQQHGGEIWVESTKGKGSTFHFTIKKQIEN